MECSQDEIVFLDTRIVATPIADKKVVITKDMYSKKSNAHHYISWNSCHPKNQTKSISIGLADRIRGNCSYNITNDITHKMGLIEYKVYLVKSGNSEKDIDKAFSKRATIPRREILKKKWKRKQNYEIKSVTEYELSLPHIYSLSRKTKHLLENNEELKNIFKNGIKDFQIVY